MTTITNTRDVWKDINSSSKTTFGKNFREIPAKLISDCETECWGEVVLRKKSGRYLSSDTCNRSVE